MFNSQAPFKLKLSRDLTKHIKRGNPWVFRDTLTERHKNAPGSLAHLYSPKDEFLGTGFYCPEINLAFRMVALGQKKIDPQVVVDRMQRALDRKRHLYHAKNDSFRLFNGEGDELPGLVCDIYKDVAVIKLDGAASGKFWDSEAIAQWLMKTGLPLKTVYFKKRNRQEDKGEVLVDGGVDLEHVQFLENGVVFETHLIDAAKTGFFLDQRDNREFIGKISQGKSLLNLFGYTGGFSVFAGLGGAREVTTVDIAPEAIKASEVNWKLNILPDVHEAVTADAFKWVKEQTKKWDVVITDPPSFAPNAQSVEAAKKAYTDIFADSIKLVERGGLFAASSCSGHIDFELFLELVQEAVSRSRRKAKVVALRGQPEDHTWPLALNELRYLKFVLVELD